MALIRHGRLAEDTWIALDDAAPVPRDGDVIVTLERWREDRAALIDRDGRLGLRPRSDQLAETIADDVAHFALIALVFPKFSDGRAYSGARLLRERHGFTGELRAVGNVLRDQFLFMHRCGFDAYEVADAKAAEAWLRALAEIAVWYQPTGDGRASVGALRRRAAKAPVKGVTRTLSERGPGEIATPFAEVPSRARGPAAAEGYVAP